MSTNLGHRCYSAFGIVLGVGFIVLAPLGLGVPTAVAQLTPAQNPTSAGVMSDVNVLFVNPATGDDTKGDGTERSPFKTITQALRIANPNSTILLAPGVYSTATGETFPLLMKPSVTIQGNPRTRGEGIVIRGGGTFSSPTVNRQDIAILGASQAVLRGVTVTNPNPQGYGLWIESSSPAIVDNTFTGNTSGGISVKGNSAPTIRSNYFYGNGGDGIIASGTLQLEVGENVFETSSFGMSVAQSTAPQAIREPQVQSASGSASLTPSEQATPAESEGNSVAGNSQPDINNRRAEPSVTSSGNSLEERTDNEVGSAVTENPAIQESPPPSAQPDRSETARQVMSLRLRENNSPLPVDELDAPATGEAAAPPVPATATPEMAADSESAASAPSESVTLRRTETPTPTSRDRQVSASPPVAEPSDTTPPPSTERISEAPPLAVRGNAQEARTQVDPEEPALATPSGTVASPQAAANAEPSATGISAASFPVPSLLSSQSSASASRVSSTSGTSPRTNAAGRPTPSPDALVQQPTLRQPATGVPGASTPSSPTEEPATTPTGTIAFSQPLPSRPSTNPTSPSTSATSRPPLATSQSQETTETDGVDIPVPRPNDSAAPVPNPTPPVPAQTSTQDNQTPPSGADSMLGRSPLTPSSQPNPEGQNDLTTNALPVLSDSSSSGNTRDTQAATTAATAPATAKGQRYRVLVEAQSEAQQKLVRSLVPGAFRTVFNGQPTMQAGLFSTRQRADEILQLLITNGFNATIEPVD